MKTAQIVLINEAGLVLGVSRKTDHNDFGLPGGKMDPEDNGDYVKTAIRETKEETGLDVYDLELIFATHKDGNMSYTYLGKYRGDISHNEPHVVKWVPFEILIMGSFGKYNQMVSESLNDKGIKYQMYTNRGVLESELRDFIESKIRNGYDKPFRFDHVYRHTLNNGFSVFLSDDVDESFIEDEEYDNKIKEIGFNHSINLSFPSHYWPK